MTIRLATNCLHIEMAVPDVPAACATFEELLGAAPIEEELVKRISGVVLDIDHRGCGDAVFQFCSPLIEDIPAAHELRRIGPCVTNLTFYVADAPGTAALLREAGAAVRTHWSTKPGSWLRFLGEGNARAAEDLADGWFMGTRHLFGFDFEFSEPPWLDPTKQRYMHPAFTYPRPHIEDKVERLLRLRVVVDDLDRHLGNVVELFDSGSRSDVYDERSDASSRSARIALRGLELEYVQPLDGRPVEPGITTAVFGVDDIDAWPTTSFDTKSVMGIDLEVVPLS